MAAVAQEGEKGRRLVAEAVYEDGVLRLLEPLPLPTGVRVRVVVEEVIGEAGGGAGGAAAGFELPGGLGVEEALRALGAPGELREALEELIGHMSRQLAERIAGDARLLELYRAADRLEPGRAAERIGPPPLDLDTWFLLVVDVLTVMEKAGLFDATRGLRAATNARLLRPYDLALAALRGDTGYLDRVAERFNAPRAAVYLVAAALAEAVRRAVSEALRGGGAASRPGGRG